MLEKRDFSPLEILMAHFLALNSFWHLLDTFRPPYIVSGTLARKLADRENVEKAIGCRSCFVSLFLLDTCGCTVNAF